MAPDVLTMTAGPPNTSHDYETLRASLAESGALLALSELHGGVSGALCAGGPPAAERWVDDFVADHDAPNLRAVHDLVSATWRTLEGGELAFEPLLPDDDAPIEEQVQALALWCHGFLSGIGAAAPAAKQRGAADASSAEVREILADFGEISRAGLDDDDTADRNASDFALAELKEYARVSTQIVFENLTGRRAAALRETH